MDMVEATKTCFRKYFDFTGRARRSEYWWFYLFATVGGIILGLADMAIFGIPFGGPVTTESSSLWSIIFSSPLADIFSVLTLIPIISAGARRLHDTGRSGFYQLIPIIPLVLLGVAFGASTSGADMPGFLLPVLGIVSLIVLILFIVWLATDGHKEENRFGPSPKYGHEATVFD